MPSLLIRLSIIYNLLHTILSFLPKKLTTVLHTSWKPINAHHDEQNQINPTSNPPSPYSSLTSIDRSNVIHVFKTFDHNGDGRITKDKLNDSLENLGIFISDTDLVSMIEKIDADGDGCIDAQEFQELYSCIMVSKGEEEEEEDMRETFDVFDANGDGYITIDELHSVLGSLGLEKGQSAEELKRMIGRVDEDGDGRVSFKEFRKMMKDGSMRSI